MSTKTTAINQNVFTLLFSQIRDFGANFEKSASAEDSGKPRVKFSVPKLKFNFLKEKYLEKAKSAVAALKRRPKMTIGVGLVLLVIILVLAFFPGVNPNSAVQKVAGQTDLTPQKQISVGRRFEVPIKTKDGTEIGEKLLVTITSVEKTQSILIQNKPAKTKEGKTFLVINIEIQNDTKNQLKVKPVDMVRLVGDDGRNYAPDVHNNEVSAEPVSLKKTRVGYVVDEGQNKFKLLIGEVRANPETIEVEF